MAERIIVLLICVAMLAYCDVPQLKRSGLREKLLYGACFVFFGYMMTSFIADAGWPTLNEVLNLLLREPSKQIVAWLQS
ncbi:hypothetical protein SAMN02799630_03481 [Paenibacillus sp. UNCCL117]|uniref:hypothetical protein n=1 Tax=unclassified Paenibacillus TaxID=185978 RepID=UPI00088C6285|nr:MULTISPECIES: hypothetical protein [unclassified Paenibacillus]SDD42156.1 hypothetical protein SAMN04488602_108138 [Paenibacillus sp. cl123]SFW47674.1 hypothetical protein SAMN02799630_03481 [Paenibacillus sp. UNCCL117]